MPSVDALKSVHTQKHQPEVDSLYHAMPVIGSGEYLIPAYVVNNKNIGNIIIYLLYGGLARGHMLPFDWKILRKAHLLSIQVLQRAVTNFNDVEGQKFERTFLDKLLIQSWATLSLVFHYAIPKDLSQFSFVI
jgi:hypothetical protein